MALDDATKAKFEESLGKAMNAASKAWLEEHGPAHAATPADAQQLLDLLVFSHLQIAARLALAGEGRWLSGHDFEKLARKAYKLAGKASIIG
ncbi:MAG: hypothetical protein NDI82_02310 [Anaeromyxobacteraceae bacterium]|nr:hypothetical protein [Anaeromyxobacteraceae bacterium]